VAFNIAQAEKAGAALVKMRAMKKQAANDYDALKAKW
jgi:hypothetical protein